MDDLQLNITADKKISKLSKTVDKTASDYKFLSKPKLTGRTIAKKRPQRFSQKSLTFVNSYGEPRNKVPKNDASELENSNDMASKLRDLSENKGKFHGKNYQELSDDITLKQKPSGGWISSLFKNNPDVPRVGQRLVKPIVEKVFSGTSFSNLDLHPHTVANLQQNLGIKDLMTVQQNTIPVILQGRDVLIRSQTGSGKTLAYALPIIDGLQAIRPKINRHDGIKVIVVVPTRELAVQTYELFIKLVKVGEDKIECTAAHSDKTLLKLNPFTWVVPGLLSGGQKRKAEKARLRKGLNILIGTPGRINDHLRHTKSLNFSKTGCLVLDEADRLLDMGYEKDVAAIVKAIEDHKKAAEYDPMALMRQTVKKKFSENDIEEVNETKTDTEYKHNLTNVLLSKQRQTILLSATLTKAVENLAGITMVDPVFVDTSEGRTVIADSLKPNQDNIKIEGKESKFKDIPEVKGKSYENETSHIEVKQISCPGKTDRKIGKMKRGLKSFSGLNHPDLFKKAEDTAELAALPGHTAKDDSDSDSDYEFFKYNKVVNDRSKDVVVENIEDEVKPSALGNTFEEAVKSAIVEDELVLPASVNQTFLVVPMKLRLVTLCSLIIEHCVLNKKGGKMIIFLGTLEMVDYHAELIETVLTGKTGKSKVKKDVKTKKRKLEDGDVKQPGEKEKSSSSESEESYSEFAIDKDGLVAVECDVFSLHGSMPHEQRMEVFKQFRTAKRGVLFCTDVAARGLDVPRVDVVLQYCAPASATDYVHRVGRTGRAAQVGAAMMFLLPSEVEFVRHLEQKRIRLRQGDEKQCLEALRSVVPGAGNAARAAIAVQTRLENVTHSNKEWLVRASRAFTSWVRFYSGYPREVREFLDARQLHLGHAAKAFALRDTPAALARRAKADPAFNKEKPTNRLTIHEDEERKRPGFPKVKIGSFGNKTVNKQSSMHTASEFDSGLDPINNYTKKKFKKS